MKNEFLNAVSPGKNSITQVRPLKTISHFVQQKMPELSVYCQTPSPHLGNDILIQLNELCNKSYDKLQLHNLLKKKDPNAVISLLDLKILHNFVSVCASMSEDEPLKAKFLEHRKRIEKIIEGAQDALKRPQVIHLTYADIILDNPPIDIRVFTSGDIGQSEAGFYIGHQIIERHLQFAINHIESALVNPDDRLEALNNAAKSIDAAREILIQYKTTLPKEHFTAFKPFFNTNPYSEEKGPSGAFSAKIPHIDVLVFGTQTPKETLDYLAENTKYFPKEDIEFYSQKSQFQLPKGLYDLMSEDNVTASEKDTIKNIEKSLLNFRKVHIGTVTHHMGKAAHGSAEQGSATDFLKKKITAQRAVPTP